MTRLDATRARRADLPARDAARRGIHLQARARAGCRLQHVAAQPAPAAPCPHRRDAGEPVSGDRGDAARAAGAALRGSGPGREGGRLLAQGGPAGDRTVGDDRGGGAAPEGPRPPFRRARRRCASGAGARSADHTRTRADCDEGIRRAGAGRGVRSRASALRAIKPAAAIGDGSDRPICVSPRAEGSWTRRNTMPRRCVTWARPGTT